jgi:hypothetical protein
MGPCPNNVVIRTVRMNFMKAMTAKYISDNLTFRVTKLVGHMISLWKKNTNKHFIT